MFKSDPTSFFYNHDSFQKKAIKQNDSGFIFIFDNTVSPSLTIWIFKQMCTSADCVRKGLAVKNVTKFFSQWLGFPLSGSGGGALHEMCDSTHILLARVT